MLNPNDGIKVGHSCDIRRRIVSRYIRSNPYCQLLYVMYTPHNVMIENNMKIRYDKELTMSNREFVQGIELEELIKTLHTLADSLKIDYTIETEEQITEFNKHILSYKEKKEITLDNTQQKIYSGITHLRKEIRILRSFYIKKGKKMKVITTPVFDIFTNKWSDIRESVKKTYELL